jgi:5-methylcytosine-specific restriction endonuclease McrA
VSSDPTSRQPDRAERLSAILRRDGDRCVWCGRSFGRLVPATTDHLVPRVKGGPSWMENEVAACRRCNGQRGHRTPIDWLADCERRGWSPDTAALGTVMDALESAIRQRGGQRRASRYLDAQRRRWAGR